MMKQIWIYDVEIYLNFHCATFQTRDGSDTRSFVIHELLNQSDSYLEFLETEVDGLIGFNNLNYDSPIINYLYLLLKQYLDPLDICMRLYEVSNKLISGDKDDELVNRLRKYKKWKEIDLFKIHHFDNKAKRTSLKAVGIAIKFPNIQDLPINPDKFILDLDEINTIVRYNVNDVEITRQLFDLTKPMIRMREQFGAKYGIDIINANDTQIGSRLIGKYLCHVLNISPYILNEMRTFRKEIDLSKIILSGIKFETPEFNSILQRFKSTILTQTKNAFKDLYVILQGVKYAFGSGGIHGANNPGVYTAAADESIVLVDVSSFYPNLAIKNRFYPKHLTEKFCDVYDNIYQTRLEAKRKGDKVIDSGLKLALNSAFGKSNDVYSFLYDPAFTMKITINGQLLLGMLAESLILKGIEIIQVNTDGIMIRCKNESIPEIKQICSIWETNTQLALDYDLFSKVIMRDVNSYIAIYKSDKAPKLKGTFMVDRELYKDHSMRIVRLAVFEYYTNGIPVEKTIYEHNDIYDFCLRYKGNKEWNGEEHSIDDYKEQVTALNKNVRFFISKSGSSLYKKNNKDGREIGIAVGKNITIFNKYFHKEMKDYNIDYGFYITEAYKIIHTVDDGQLKLF